jgi:hypothetical protein
MPTSAFKELEITSLTPEERTSVFYSSGTTGQKRSRHFHNAQSLAIYEASLLPWFRRHFCVDAKIDGLFLTPSPALAPNSSLAHMFETIRPLLDSSTYTGQVDEDGGWALDMEATLDRMKHAATTQRPMAVFGTAFSFVHLADHLERSGSGCVLAPGSRVFETGGYKGRSRSVEKRELHRLIARWLGVRASFILSEYGMSELSSQAYDGIIGNAGRAPGSRVFHFPPWARSHIISTETGEPVADGETGLARIVDLANVRSVLAIQTEDLAIRRAAGFELLGRAEDSEPRGCSLMPV